VIITGLDLSLASTGLARIDGGQVWLHRLKPAPRKGHERLAWLMRAVAAYAEGSDLIVVEGAAYNATQGAFNLGGGWWVVMHHLWEKGLRVHVIVQTQTLKVYACGHGGSARDPVGKDRVVREVAARYPMVKLAPTDNDKADALVLAAMGAHRYGFPLAPVPDHHARALKVPDWPGETVPGSGSPAVQGALL
jgi:Holliday junction resolvasome RuvABC endonuclease subunit